MSRKSILLVEDDPNDEELTIRALKKNNIKNKVIVARDGAEALDILFGKAGQDDDALEQLPQLVLLDLKLPKVDGHGVLKKIRENARTRFLPVVILTTSKEEQDVFNSYRLGANSFIQKPINFQQFIDAVGQLGLYWLVLNESLDAHPQRIYP